MEFVLTNKGIPFTLEFLSKKFEVSEQNMSEEKKDIKKEKEQKPKIYMNQNNLIVKERKEKKNLFKRS